MSNGQYRLEAFGFQSEWNLWRIAHGGLDEPEIERATPHERREQRRLYRSDFGSDADLAFARRIFPRELHDYLHPYNPTRMVPKPPLLIVRRAV